MGELSVAISILARTNCKGTELCCNSDSLWSWCHVGRERWNERINDLESDNIQHITLNDKTQLAKLCTSIGTKADLVTGCLCNKEWANCCISRNLSDGKDTEMSTVSQHSPTKWKCKVRSSDLEMLICNPRWTKREHKRIHALLLVHFEHARTMISSKYILTWNPIHLQRNSMCLVSEFKTLRL